MAATAAEARALPEMGGAGGPEWLDGAADAAGLLMPAEPLSSPVPLLSDDGTRRWLASVSGEDEGGGGGATQSATQGKMLRGEPLLLLLLSLLPPDSGMLPAGRVLKFPSRSPTILRTSKHQFPSKWFRYILGYSLQGDNRKGWKDICSLHLLLTLLRP